MTAPDQPRSGPTYEQALAAAAALQAAAGSEDAAIAAVASLAEQVIAVRERVTDWALRLISGLWAPVDPYDGAAVQQFTIDAAAHMQTAQTVVARSAGAAQAQELAAIGVGAPAAPSDPVDVRRKTLTEDGVVDRPATAEIRYSDTGERKIVDLDEEATTVGIFNRPARTYRYLESKGVDVEQARAEALTRMQRLVEDNLMLAQRLAEAEVIAGAAEVDSGIIGLRRIIHPELSRTGTCGLCIVAADQVYRVRTLMPIHGRCKCTVAAVLEDFDPADVLNKADIKAIYDAAGGTDGVLLKRVRVQFDEHGEFGSVMSPVREFKPRKDYQRPYERRARQFRRADQRYPQRPRQAF